MILRGFFLMLILPFFSFGQKSFNINESGQLNKREYKKLGKKNGYDLISMFDTISYDPLLVFAITLKNKKLGIIDSYGKVILKNEYDEIDLRTSSNRLFPGYHDHLFLRKNNQWAIANLEGKLITPFKYQGLVYEEYRNVDVQKNNPLDPWNIYINKDSIFKAYVGEYKHVYLNTKGEEVKFMGYDEREQKNHGKPYQPKPFKIEGDNFNIPKELGKARLLKDHFFIVTAKRNNDFFYGVYDTLQKKVIVPIEYDIFPNTDFVPFFFVRKSDYTHVFDLSGNKVTDLPLKHVYEIGTKKNAAIIAKNEENKLAIFSKSFHPITDFIYDQISFSNKLIMGRIGEQYHLMDYLGKEKIFDVTYDKMYLRKHKYDGFEKSYIYLVKEKKIALVDEEGKLISDFGYEYFIPECFVNSGGHGLSINYDGRRGYPNQYIFFKKDGKFGLMDNDLNIILKNEYDILLKSRAYGFIYLGEDIDAKKYQRKWGVFDVNKKKQIIPIQFTSWINNTYTFFQVRENGKYGLYDKNGIEIFPTENEEKIEANYIFKGLFSFEKKYKTPFAYIDSTGKLVYLDH